MPGDESPRRRGKTAGTKRGTSNPSSSVTADGALALATEANPDARPHFYKVATAPFAKLACRDGVSDPVRVVCLVLWRGSRDGLELAPGELRDLLGENADRHIRTAKKWGLLTEGSHAGHLRVPAWLAWSALEYADPDALADLSAGHWFSMPKNGGRAATLAFYGGCPLWFALALFAASTGDSKSGPKGTRTYHTSRAELGDLFVKGTGELVSPQTFTQAVRKAVERGLLVEGSTCSRLIISRPLKPH